MFRLSILLLLTGPLLPLTVTEAAAGYGAAVVMQNVDREFRFKNGDLAERQFRRIGLEYWENAGDFIAIGFAVGYSKNEGQDVTRAFETVSGNYGGLSLRVDVPLHALISIRGGVGYLLQLDDRTVDLDSTFETRLQDVRAEVGAHARYRRADIGLGVSWTRADYREMTTTSAGDTVYHAVGDKDTGAFATLGLLTGNDGLVALRYDKGAENGISLRFQRNF